LTLTLELQSLRPTDVPLGVVDQRGTSGGTTHWRACCQRGLCRSDDCNGGSRHGGPRTGRGVAPCSMGQFADCKHVSVVTVSMARSTGRRLSFAPICGDPPSPGNDSINTKRFHIAGQG
jgi:hypothetical protein